MKILDELVQKVKSFIGGDKQESSSAERTESAPEPEIDPTEPGYGSMRVQPGSDEPEGDVHATITPITDRPSIEDEEDPFGEPER
jgi:hypothetical protein